MVPYAILIFAIVSSTGCLAAPYNGKLIGNLQTNAHGVRGAVYAVDDRRIRLVGFSYDGTGPDAFFWGNLRSAAGNKPMSNDYIILKDETGSMDILGKYDNRDITISLPEGYTITSIKYLSVWCKKFAVNFGHVEIPAGFVPPSEQNIGQFSQLAHGLRSGEITVKDARTFLIRDLHYDGAGPDAYFWVGTSSSPSSNGDKIPDENGSTSKLKGYTGQTITIQLPEGKTVRDIRWLSMWCVRFTENFGHVLIPENLNVPPVFAESPMSQLGNCETLHKKMNVAWNVNNTHITVEMSGKLEKGEYMAFGLSGQETSSSMINADVAVTYLDGNKPMAVDYYLTQYAQCSQGQGACPDTRTGGIESLLDISGSMKDGITMVKYSRLLNTGDSKDKVIDSSKEMYVVWALGLLNSDKLVTKHSVRSGNVKMHFGRKAERKCSPIMAEAPKPVTPWRPLRLTGTEANNTFTAQIGPTGGRRGYTAITGHTSWGIAWFINGMLIPEITVRRNETYTFIVEGGNDDKNTAKYHPFYITNDPVGGYIQKTEEEKKSYNVYAGLTSTGSLRPDSVGRYCEWEFKTVDTSEERETFQEFKKDLVLKCESGSAGTLQWTPDKATPNTVYYQCYTHRYLGWKINVVDEYPVGSAASSYVSLLLTLICLTAAALCG